MRSPRVPAGPGTAVLVLLSVQHRPYLSRVHVDLFTWCTHCPRQSSLVSRALETAKEGATTVQNSESLVLFSIVFMLLRCARRCPSLLRPPRCQIFRARSHQHVRTCWSFIRCSAVTAFIAIRFVEAIMRGRRREEEEVSIRP